MSSSLNGTGVTFGDSTSQATAFVGVRSQLFTSTGTFTVPTGITAIKVTVIGGGGGGGSTSSSNNYLAAGGGGGGGVAVKFITGLTPGSTITATVGGGGGAASSGGTSSFGAYCSATGGGGGTSNTGTYTPSYFAGGAGGSGSSGDFNYTGSPGVAGFADGYANPRSGAGGGSLGPAELSRTVATSAPASPEVTSFWLLYGGRGFLGGKGGNGWYGQGAAANHAGEAGTGYGNGGSGTCKYNTNYSGGSGSAGCVLVEW